MKCKWLLEKEVFEENINPIREAIVSQGMEYKLVHYTPSEGLERTLPLFDKDDCVIAYGSLGFARQIKRLAPWIPGVWCNLTKFQCSHYYSHLGKFLLNDTYMMVPYGELLRLKEFIFDEGMAINGEVFVRPDSGYKLFTGMVAKYDTWEKDVEFMGFYDVAPEKLVVIAPPKKIVEEWRLVVVEKQVVAASQYKENGLVKLREGCPDEVSAFAQKVIAKGWEPDLAYVMDICQLQHGDIRLIELNSFSCSGMYACDKSAMVEAASRLALKEWKDYHELEKYYGV